jgi:hypothetical protein
LAVLITKYGPAQSQILDNRFAAKAQQHLQFPFSVALPPVSPTHLSFIPPVIIGRIHVRNDKLYISEWEMFGSLVERATSALIWSPR